MRRFRGGLEIKAHRRFYHSSLGSSVMKKKKNVQVLFRLPRGGLHLTRHGCSAPPSPTVRFSWFLCFSSSLCLCLCACLCPSAPLSLCLSVSPSLRLRQQTAPSWTANQTANHTVSVSPRAGGSAAHPPACTREAGHEARQRGMVCCLCMVWSSVIRVFLCLRCLAFSF